jgi:VanZ family protein
LKLKPLLFTTALVYTGLILYLSLINLAETPVKNLGISDKVMHLGAYFGLALLWMLYAISSFENRNLVKYIIIISAASIAFGIFIEVLQGVLTSYRRFDLYDIIANTVGVIIAGFVVWIMKEYLIRLKANINLDLMKK